MEVTSEILSSFQTDPQSKPLINSKHVVSKFTFSCPSLAESLSLLEKDDDGDYVVKRKDEVFNEICITLGKLQGKLEEAARRIHYRGHPMQDWVKMADNDDDDWGALLLADYLVHFKHEIEEKTVLELGAGVGLTSIIAGMYARQIVCTDVDRGDILKLLTSNIHRNKCVMKGEAVIAEIDFFNREWSREMQEKMKEVSVVIAADVIYDNDVTDAFISTITKILKIPPKKSLYLAMEKRYVFTIADLDSVAPCYEYLLSRLDAAKREEPFSLWKIEQVSLDFPQYFDYERVKELTMFKIHVT